MMTKKQMAGAFFLTLMFSMDISAAASQPRGKTYKWVDENGVIHYSDKAPLEATKREKIILDREGRSIEKIEAPTTEDTNNANRDKAGEQRAEKTRQRNAALQDQALLSSYLKVEDFDFACDRALAALDAQIKSSQIMLNQHHARQKMLLERKETGTILAVGELEKLEEDIALRKASIERDQRQKEAVRAKYELDKQRWNELKEAEKARIEAEKQARKK